ncbi:MAG: hypothetical protein ACKV1O_03720 [Saprospiraceae bacterium]
MTLRELKETANVLIGKSDFEGIFDMLSKRLDPARPVFIDLTQLSSRYNRVFKDDMNGVVSRENASLEYNQNGQALVQLVRKLAEEDLGSGGDLDDPLDLEARKLPVDIPVTPLFLVNCDRRKPIRAFWRAFSAYTEQHRHFQFYFLPSCPSQEPEGFAERTVQELLEKELDKATSVFDFRRRATEERLQIEPLPTGLNLAGSQKAFKTYFAERFGLANSEIAFEDYLQTGLPKLPWQYVATAFKITASEWDEELLPPYIGWIMDTFSQTGPDIPTFIFFFVVSVKNAHREDILRGDQREALKSVRDLVGARSGEATLIEPLLPVPADDFEEWLEKLGDVSTDQKRAIIELMAARLRDEEEAWFRQTREFNMERIEDFQKKVYNSHKHK